MTKKDETRKGYVALIFAVILGAFAFTTYTGVLPVCNILIQCNITQCTGWNSISPLCWGTATVQTATCYAQLAACQLMIWILDVIFAITAFILFLYGIYKVVSG